MDQAGSFRLVGPRDGSLVVAVIIPVLVGGWILLAFGNPRLQGQPSNVPVAIGLISAVGLAFEILVLLHRRRMRSTRLVVDEQGASLYVGARRGWRIEWCDLESVSLRTYTLRYSFFHEALVFAQKDGLVRMVPTDSILYGKMPELNAVSGHLRGLGWPVESDYRPTWLAPG